MLEIMDDVNTISVISHVVVLLAVIILVDDIHNAMICLERECLLERDCVSHTPLTAALLNITRSSTSSRQLRDVVGS